MIMSRERLYQMAAAADAQLKQFASSNEEQDPRYGRRVVRAVAGGAGLTYGAAKLKQAVTNKAGAVDDYGNLTARKGMYKDAAKSWAGQGAAAAKTGAQNAYAVAKPAAQKAAAVGKEKLKQGIIAGTRGAVKATEKGGIFRNTAGKVLKTVKNWSRADMDRIVDLAARIEAQSL
jgi:hypothetical protein